MADVLLKGPLRDHALDRLGCRINPAVAGAYTITLSGTNTITSGGILLTTAIGSNLTTITGGTLRGAAFSSAAERDSFNKLIKGVSLAEPKFRPPRPEGKCPSFC